MLRMSQMSQPRGLAQTPGDSGMLHFLMLHLIALYGNGMLLASKSIQIVDYWFKIEVTFFLKLAGQGLLGMESYVFIDKWKWYTIHSLA